ncbi:MAG: hypothetical protein ACFFA0_16720 [Promethearchaeota archaeon]
MKVKELWNFKYNAPILGIEVADINNNGQLEIIAFTKTGILLFISLKGKLLHKEVISKNSSQWHLRVHDVDNDGRYEIILGGIDGILRIFKCKSTYNLVPFWTHKFNSSISGILIEDINNDNINELIVFSLDKTLRVLNPFDGKLIWGQVFEDGVGDAIIFINNKNSANKEVLACGNDGTIRCFGGNTGKLLWFKKYSEKLRVISYMNTLKEQLVLSGGDDKKLHILNKITQNELRTMQFNNYIWKCVSYPFPILNNVLVSSYSFAYFDESIPIENLEFTSKLVCLNEYFETKWELKGYNVECLRIIKFYNRDLIIIGTTKGKLLIIEEQTGKIQFNGNYNSCVNMSQICIEERLIFSCHDDGTIITYNIDKI